MTTPFPPPARPSVHLNALLVVASSVLAGLATVLVLAVTERLPTLLVLLPVAMTLAATAAAVAAGLLRADAAGRHDERLRWASAGFGVTALGMAVQLLGFPTVAPGGGPFGTTGSGAASLYFHWHLVLPVFVLAGCWRPTAGRRVRRWATAVAVGSLLWLAVGALPGPVWFTTDLAYLPRTTTTLWLLAGATVVAVVAWMRSTGRRPHWGEAWVSVGLLLAAWDLTLHAVGPERFTSWWWASLLLRVASVLVPAVGLVAGAVRMHALLDRHSARLEEHAVLLHAANTELERVNDELVRTNRELDAFASVIAHDLRAPMTTAQGFVQLVLRFHELAPETRDLLERAQAGQQRQADLVGDLLVLARSRDADLAPRPVDLADVVVDLVLDTPDLTAAVRIDGDLPHVVADPTALRQVLHNLLTNALVHAGREGSLPDVLVRASCDGTACTVEVVDDGPGVPHADRGRLFEPFERGPDSHQRPGSGLGLAICRRLVDRHGGTLGVDDAPGGGSRFWFTLPGDPTAVPQSREHAHA